MSLTPEKRDRGEVEFTSELGWLATLAASIVAMTSYMFAPLI